MAKIKMCETGCGERARFRSHKGYELCRTCYVERRVGEVEPEVQAYRARQPNPAALPTREEVEAVGQAWIEAFFSSHSTLAVDVPFGSEYRALDIIRERVAEVTGDRRDPEKADDAAKNSCDRAIDRKRDTEPAPPPDPYTAHRLANAAERHITNPETSDLDQRIAAVRTDADPVEEWSVFESPTWEE